MAVLGRHYRGTIAEFDEARGLGVIEEKGGARYGFHCVAIAGGTRTIEVDTAVIFGLIFGRNGSIEATAIAPCAPAL